MRVNGSCYCGQITYEADVDPNSVRVCHCTDCQQLTGSAFRAVIVVPSDKFTLLTGEPKTYVKTADSGNKRSHAFCGHCGSPMFACAISDTPSYTLRVGSIRERAQLRPNKQIWCRSALPWVMTLDAVEKFSQQ
jgi:hypothetical protein